jgi:hypothetical protein
MFLIDAEDLSDHPRRDLRRVVGYGVDTRLRPAGEGVEEFVAPGAHQGFHGAGRPWPEGSRDRLAVLVMLGHIGGQWWQP